MFRMNQSTLNSHHQSVSMCFNHSVYLCLSSGVGRTGAFCLLYAALQELEAGNGIPDLPLLVKKMRQQRKNMLQEKVQGCFNETPSNDELSLLLWSCFSLNLLSLCVSCPAPPEVLLRGCVEARRACPAAPWHHHSDLQQEHQSCSSKGLSQPQELQCFSCVWTQLHWPSESHFIVWCSVPIATFLSKASHRVPWWCRYIVIYSLLLV